MTFLLSATLAYVLVLSSVNPAAQQPASDFLPALIGHSRLRVFLGANRMSHARRISLDTVQSIGKQINSSPIERPEALVVVPSHQLPQLFLAIRDTIRAYGFEVARFDRQRYILDATHVDGAASKDYDRAFIWLERDLLAPNDQVGIHFIYGRYEFLMARLPGVFRVVVDSDFEERRIGKLKAAIVRMADSR